MPCIFRVTAIWRATLIGALALACIGAPPAFGQDRKFMSGYAGSLPHAPRDLARTYFGDKAVRGLIYDLEAAPMPRAKAEAQLAGSGATLDDLIRVRLIRPDGDLVRLGFSYFTAADMELIHGMVARYAPSLVAAYVGDAPRLNSIFAAYNVPTVDPKRLAFALIVGVGLNWQGLDLLFDTGYRKPILVEGPDWKYSFWASEEQASYDYRGYYWGSTTFPAGAANLNPNPVDYAFASFGDPMSDPRMNFPDLLDTHPDQMTAPVRAAAEAIGLHDDLQFGETNVLTAEFARQLGPILFALRAQPQDAKKLATTLATTPGTGDLAGLERDLQLLAVTGYVAHGRDGRWTLTAPVLDRQDKAMLSAALAENRAILDRWTKGHYAAMRADLTGLTALRQGVPYEALYTQIWHELFGRVTRELVERGVVADPHAPGNPSPGSLPMVWRTSIYNRVWQ